MSDATIKTVAISIIKANKGGNYSVSVNDFRVAGGKAWCGGTVIAQWKVPLGRIIDACPDLKTAISAVTESPDAAAIRDAEDLPDYDAGLLNDFGGGDVNWWHDYLRAEIGRANEYWRALLNTTGKEVTDPGRNAPPSDAAPAGLSAGGGAEGPFRFDPEDWAEDFAHENGNYLCLCMGCDRQFFGHKRRVVCKTCALSAHVNEKQKSEHIPGDVLTPATKGRDA